MITEGNEPAQPTTTDVESYHKQRGYNYNPDKGLFYFYGLTKREYFAAMALQGLLANNIVDPALAAGQAVDQANLLIDALNKFV